MKNEALVSLGRDFYARFCCLFDAILDLTWWTQRPFPQQLSFAPLSFSVYMITDASLTGWGAAVDGREFFGQWEFDDTIEIAFLELKVVWLALKASCYRRINFNVHLSIDNQVALAYISKMGVDGKI